ncbi:serine/threonine-protein phosphatase 4 regulatory subunit 1 [Capsaspora owczarzaki ATCC 30864]|uniref:Serine/threonine-protein phosphatase 4 regulatory subunit 1 n=1 Tax=Capsaspora owczarzaki (strain ATCC 30864) TaxID=595528 RepID=A0A0D2VWY4_CAPO3|nr:serine/threonine-protein phosphatase 4 regulatory subunit 1 [Capsaspora owczarzaki ATCC 30864]KJE96097.1 serine/threonine-protein phosphatase 4 regulatory subunit 1 [Capsaspora owczarzaki ATCC 30864]|eukprot:XP_004345215.1 serine/threonine-protein phosphatase 4 regulatory subunit 1 [Capsaspora owczarzaki ATCC 30864]
MAAIPQGFGDFSSSDSDLNGGYSDLNSYSSHYAGTLGDDSDASGEMEDSMPTMEEMSIDDSLTPVERMLKYARSDLVLHRLFVAKDIVDTLRSSLQDSNMDSILQVVGDLMADPEPLIRQAILQQAAPLAKVAFAHPQLPNPRAAVVELLRLSSALLPDSIESVRQVAQTAFLSILELGALLPSDIETLVCPVLLRLATDDLEDENRMNAITLMSKSTPFVSRSVVERIFLPQICILSEDAMFRVRKSCACAIGPISLAIGTKLTVDRLLPKYIRMCSDKIWGVRKGCAESLPDIAQVATPEIRETALVGILESFATDVSRWVRSSAFQFLGPFIATFANTAECVEYPVPPPELREQHGLDAPSTDESSEAEVNATAMTLGGVTIDESADDAASSSRTTEDETPASPPPVVASPTAASVFTIASPAKPVSEMNKVEDFNAFNFWRAPIPAFEIDAALLSPAKPSPAKSAAAPAPAPAAPATTAPATAAPIATTTPASTASPAPAVSATPVPAKEVELPYKLLEFYIQMAEPSSTRSIDNDIGFHCAYSLPAVVLILGASKWRLVRDTFLTLSRDLQWKVRRSLAHSLHELAAIIGPELTETDLRPVFDVFLKDLDEVRVGVVKHFADFLTHLAPEARAQYLSMLEELKKTENTQNWRFRRLLAKQLDKLSQLFSAHEVKKHISPVTLALAADDVASVRGVAHRSLAFMVNRLLQEGATSSTTGSIAALASDLSNHVIEQFACGPSFVSRMNYVQICQHFVEVVAPEAFTTRFLPSLLSLANDRVANVRLSLARLITQTLLVRDYFVALSTSDAVFQSTLQQLRTDRDRDVAYYANLAPGSDSTNPLVLEIQAEEADDLLDGVA